MSGTYSSAGIVLNQEDWINQPAGYEMVNLVAPLPSGNQMRGTVEGAPGCTAFVVTK